MWICETNAKDVFKISEVDYAPHNSTSLPYVITGKTERELVSKVFIAPYRDENTGKYEIDQLIPRDEMYIIGQAVNLGE